jgi:hypothetical protein
VRIAPAAGDRFLVREVLGELVEGEELRGGVRSLVAGTPRRRLLIGVREARGL